MLECRTSGASGWLIANQWQSTYQGDLIFQGRSGGTSSTEKLRLKSTGSVGVEIGNGDLELRNTVSSVTNSYSQAILFKILQTMVKLRQLLKSLHKVKQLGVVI